MTDDVIGSGNPAEEGSIAGDLSESDDDASTGNPLAQAFDLNVSLPPFEVRMVNAAVLEEYEIWGIGASFLAAAVVGFAVAFMQSFHSDSHGIEHSDPVYLVPAVIFGTMLGLAIWRLLTLRGRLRRDSKTYPMTATPRRGKGSS